MGYSIKDISELETFDYSLCNGFSTKDTVRKSLDDVKQFNSDIYKNTKKPRIV